MKTPINQLCFKIGTIVLSLWVGLNLLLALYILANMVLMGGNAPGLYIILDKKVVDTLEPNVLWTMNGIAMLLNAAVAALCGMSLFLIWYGVAKKTMWTFWALASSLLFLQFFGFLSDGYFDNTNLGANIFSSFVLFIGLAASYMSIKNIDSVRWMKWLGKMKVRKSV
jgi:hypothetical protein